MSTIQDELKQRIAVVLRDLHENGKDDPEAVWMIGSLAAAITDKADSPSWPDFKDGLTADMYDGLLADIQSQGNAHYQSGDLKRAYALQALGLSLVCRTQRNDSHMREGEMLLDAMITAAVDVYRRTEGIH